MIFTQVFLFIFVLQKLDVSPFTSVIRPKQTGSKTASVIGLSSFKKYESCPNKTCFGKKLLNNTCPNCKKTYNEKESTMSVVCSVMLEDDEHNFDQVSLFTKQVTEICSLDLTRSEQSLQEDFVKCLPCKINYTKSPKKDSTIVQLRKCWLPEPQRNYNCSCWQLQFKKNIILYKFYWKFLQLIRKKAYSLSYLLIANISFCYKSFWENLNTCLWLCISFLLVHFYV